MFQGCWKHMHAKQEVDRHANMNQISIRKRQSRKNNETALCVAIHNAKANANAKGPNVPERAQYCQLGRRMSMSMSMSSSISSRHDLAHTGAHNSGGGVAHNLTIR